MFYNLPSLCLTTHTQKKRTIYKQRNKAFFFLNFGLTYLQSQTN